ncbi:MAG TPA: hypothetical protein VHV31_14710 [Nitrolancea sp.]|nr:hypothetical protein [Nitrolancea sp.]
MRVNYHPYTPAEQIAHLRMLLGEAESLLREIAALGESVPREATTDVRWFVDLVEVLLHNESVEVG